MKTPCMLVVAATAVAAIGCNSQSTPQAAQKPAVASAASQEAVRPVDPSAAPTPATVGATAPDFTLSDLDGQPVKLSSFRGKTVVLEWFNPGCPFVRKSHTAAKGGLKDYPARAQKEGVVWLAVNSSAAGKQGNEPKMNRDVATEFKMGYPVLRDEDGKVGHLYGATNTPHVYVVDPKGTLVYRGAIDNSPDGEGESPAGGSLVNYVEEALAAIKDGKPVRVPETKAYGCGVKYAS